MTVAIHLMLRAVLPAVLLVLGACAAPYGAGDDDGWRPLRLDSPALPTSAFRDRALTPPAHGSVLTVPRLTGRGTAPAPLLVEEGNVWPAPAPPRATLTDPAAVTRDVPAFGSQPLSPEPALREDAARPSAGVRGGRPGIVTPRPDGRVAVEGAGTEGVWSYGVPGRPGVGTAFPDQRGGSILMEPGGGTVIVPR